MGVCRQCGLRVDFFPFQWLFTESKSEQGGAFIGGGRLLGVLRYIFFVQKVVFSCAQCLNLVLPCSGGNFGIQKCRVTDLQEYNILGLIICICHLLIGRPNMDLKIIHYKL